MSKSLLVLIGVLIIATGYLLFQGMNNQPQESERIIKLAAIEKSHFEQWKEFSSPNEEFTVLLPTLPQHATDVLEDGQKQYDIFVSEKEDGSAFAITMIKFSEEMTDAEIEEFTEKVIEDLIGSNPENEVFHFEQSTLKNYETVDFKFGNSSWDIMARLLRDDNTLFMLTTMVQKGQENDHEFQFFSNSFEVKGN